MMKIGRDVIKRHIWAFPFEVIMVLSIPVFVATGQFGHAFATMGILVACMLLPVVERVWGIRFAPILHCLYVGFLFVSLYAAELLDMYGKITLWDDGVHIISGLLVGVVSVVWMTHLHERQTVRLPVWLQVFMVIATGALVAVVWELMEFTSDHVLGTFMQRADLFDTMTDMAYGLGGAVIVASLFGRYLLQRRSFGIRHILTQQRQVNK